jgi:RHS repeat-associated protein
VIDALKLASPLAAPARPWRASATLTSPRKTRVRGFCRRPPGRRRARRSQVPGSALSCPACDYKTASGRGFWPNRDPIGERDGANLYAFVRNAPMRRVDGLGTRSCCPEVAEARQRCLADCATKLSICNGVVAAGSVACAFSCSTACTISCGPAAPLCMFSCVAGCRLACGVLAAGASGMCGRLNELCVEDCPKCGSDCGPCGRT